MCNNVLYIIVLYEQFLLLGHYTVSVNHKAYALISSPSTKHLNKFCAKKDTSTTSVRMFPVLQFCTILLYSTWCPFYLWCVTRHSNMTEMWFGPDPFCNQMVLQNYAHITTAVLSHAWALWPHEWNHKKNTLFPLDLFSARNIWRK